MSVFLHHRCHHRDGLRRADGFYRKDTKEHSLPFRAGAKHDRDNFIWFGRFRVTLLRLAKMFGWTFQEQAKPQSDSGRLFEELKTDLAGDGYRCPETVLRVFAQGVVSEAYRIRSGFLNNLISARRQHVEAERHSHRPTRARTG